MPLILHGMTNTFEFNVWTAMKKRCYYKKHVRYHLYGGRGITICDRWHGDFKAFVEDMGKCPYENGSIDRIDNDRGYEPDNCRWIPKVNQSANRRCVTTIGGMSLEAFAKLNNVPASTLRLRLKQGWSEDQLMTVKRERKGNALYKISPSLQGRVQEAGCPR